MEKKEEKGRFTWKDAVELLKDGVEFAEKIVGGRNALIAGVVGLTIGIGIGAKVIGPSDEACAEHILQKQAERQREALKKFLSAPARGGF